LQYESLWNSFLSTLEGGCRPPGPALHWDFAVGVSAAAADVIKGDKEGQVAKDDDDGVSGGGEGRDDAKGQISQER
jgi:hypothetical protein